MQKILCYFSFLFFLLSTLYRMSAQENSSMELQSISIEQPWHPILIGKPNNIALLVKLEMKGSRNALKIKQMRLSTFGSDHMGDIRTIGIYYTGDSTSFYASQAFDHRKSPKQETIFEGDFRLNEGTNHFWVVCELSPQTNLAHRIRINCSSVTLSNGQVYSPKGTVEKLRTGYALRQRGQDGIHTFRIPGLATTNEGTLIAVYDTRRNGSVDLQEDIDVGMSRSTDGGQTWEPMKVIMDMGEWGGKPEAENGIGDPSVLVDRETNTIWVAGIWAHGHPGQRNWWASKQGMTPELTSQFVLVKSEDDGLTWSEPINITSQIKNPEWHLLLQGPGKGITLRDGTLVFPAQYKDKKEVPHSTLIYSKDHGKTWQIGTGAKSKTTEAQIVELSDGSLMLNMRDDRGRNNPKGGARSVAITRNLGKTWKEHPTSAKALVEPVCMASLIQVEYQGKSLLIFSNPAVPKGPRREMAIKISEDEGMTWPSEYHLLLNADNGYGYSCLTLIDEEHIGILYEGPGELFFQRIALSEILQKGK